MRFATGHVFLEILGTTVETIPVIAQEIGVGNFTRGQVGHGKKRDCIDL
jgi:hypothetical protein